MKLFAGLLAVAMVVSGCSRSNDAASPKPSSEATEESRLTHFETAEQDVILTFAKAGSTAAQALASVSGYRPLYEKEQVLTSGDKTGQKELIVFFAYCEPKESYDDCERSPAPTNKPDIYMYASVENGAIRLIGPKMFVAYTHKWYLNCDSAGFQLNKHSITQLKLGFDKFVAKGQGDHTLSIDFPGNKEFPAQENVSWSCFVNPNDAPQTQISP